MDQTNTSIDPKLLQDQTAWVRGLARSLALDPSGADDVAQEAMLAALQSPPHEAEDARRLRAWLSRVVFNLSNLRVRRDSRRRSREEWVARPERTSSVAETVERAAQLRIVVDEVMDLPEPYRSTVLMRYFEGLSTQDTADAMDCSPVTVRKRLSRALQRMRSQLDRKHGGDGATWLAALAPLLGEPPLSPVPLATPPGQPPGSIGVALGWASGPILAGLALVVGGGVAGSKLLSTAPEPDLEVAAAEPTPLVSPDEPGTVRRRAVPLLAEDGARTRPRDERGAGEGAERSTRSEWIVELESAPPAAAPVTVTGHVFDLAGFPLAGLEIHEAGEESPLDVSAWDGSFHLTATSGEHELTARSAGHATLRAAVLRQLTADTEPVIIAGPSIDASGAVTDGSGLPLGNARIELEVGEALFDFPHRADHTRAVERSTRTGPDGRFQLDDWITGRGLALRVSREGYLTTRVPVPAASTAGLHIVLAAEPVYTMQGMVFHRSGEPAAGTRVELAGRSVETDAYGGFALAYGEVGLDEALWISKPGYQSKHIPRFGAQIAALDHRLPILQLVLGGPSRSIVGRLFGPEGEPLAGWEVAALEVVEATDGGEPSPVESPRLDWTETAEGGEFRFNGLGDGRYVVQAFDTETLVMVRSEAIEAGSDEPEHLELTVPPDALHRVAGRVVARDGAPLRDALVTVVLSVPSHAGSAIREGESTRTDAQGRFLLSQVPYAYADLRIDHEHVSSVVQSLASVPDPDWVEIEVPRDRFVRFEDAGLGADQIAVVDRQGRTLAVRPAFAARTERVPLRRGESGVVAVTEDASEMVVYREGSEVQRFRLDLPEGSVSTVSAAASPQLEPPRR